MKIDWSKAPEGATHYGPGNYGMSPAWYKKQQDGCWMYWLVDDGYEWGVAAVLPHNAVARTAEWDDAGLLSVGTKCEAHIYNDLWAKCTVVAHFEGRAVVVMDNREVAQIRDANHLRPIHTPEQIASEKREKAISAMLEVFITGVERDTEQNTRSGIEALYDAGYHITEQEQDQ